LLSRILLCDSIEQIQKSLLVRQLIPFPVLTVDTLGGILSLAGRLLVKTDVDGVCEVLLDGILRDLVDHAANLLNYFLSYRGET
jgi:hypothetical protein